MLERIGSKLLDSALIVLGQGILPTHVAVHVLVVIVSSTIIRRCVSKLTLTLTPLIIQTLIQLLILILNVKSVRERRRALHLVILTTALSIRPNKRKPINP